MARTGCPGRFCPTYQRQIDKINKANNKLVEMLKDFEYVHDEQFPVYDGNGYPLDSEHVC